MPEGTKVMEGGGNSMAGAKEEYEGPLNTRQYFFVIQWIAVSSGLTMFNKVRATAAHEC
jgi:hypothetical protein